MGHEKCNSLFFIVLLLERKVILLKQQIICLKFEEPQAMPEALQGRGLNI